MIRRLTLILILFAFHYVNGQEWSLKLKSTVQLRTWTLTSRADKDERSINGANIQLIQNNKVIKELVSDPDGNFVIDIPGNGDYYINVSYPGCNAKKFYVSTKNVASDVAGNNFKPSVTIGGFMMAKPFEGIDYLGLQEPLLAVEYKTNEFDKDKAVSDKGVQIVQNIMDAEMTLINKFCFQTKLGDEALTKKNYKLAKQYYTKALEIIPNEDYPKFKLAKAEEKIKEEEAKKEVLAAEQAAKVEAQKIALQKAMEEKKAKENASFNQGTKPAESQTLAAVKDSIIPSNSDAAAKAKEVEATKLAAEQAAKEKADSEALAKVKEAEKAAKDKADAETASKAKSDAEAVKLAAEQTAKAKAESDAKAKAEADKLAAEKVAKDKANADAAAKLVTEKAAKDKADADAKTKADANASKTTASSANTQNTSISRSITPVTNVAVSATTNSQVANSELSDPTTNNTYASTNNSGRKKAKRKIKAQIGSAYAEHISSADTYFKDKKYKEAKQAYAKALKHKPNDNYASTKISECNGHLK